MRREYVLRLESRETLTIANALNTHGSREVPDDGTVRACPSEATRSQQTVGGSGCTFIETCDAVVLNRGDALEGSDGVRPLKIHVRKT